ncbi:hypothetical protein D3C87_1165710 [compost metagenome]
MRNRDLPSVFHEDPHRRYSALHRHQPAFDGERPDTGKDVAAVLAVIDTRLVDQHLGKQIVDVGLDARRRFDDCHFAGQRIAATNAIDLPRIRRTHDRQQQTVTKGLLLGQIVGQEVSPFRRPAAHKQARNACLAHIQSPSSSRLSTYRKPFSASRPRML